MLKILYRCLIIKKIYKYINSKIYEMQKYANV